MYAGKREGCRGGARGANEQPLLQCEEVTQCLKGSGNPWQTSTIPLEGFTTCTLQRRGESIEEQLELLSCEELRRWLEENSLVATDAETNAKGKICPGKPAGWGYKPKQ